MAIPNDLVERISDDPAQGFVELFAYIRKGFGDNPAWSDREYDSLLEALALSLAVCDAARLNLEEDVPAITGNKDLDCQRIIAFLHSLDLRFKTEIKRDKFEILKDEYKARIGSGHFYEFSQGDLDRIQILISELRENIAKSKYLDDAHRRRLILRLEKLQSELHKKVSSLDHFWGLVGDAGVALGKFGKDAKPLVDRIGEIVRIVWATQARSEELLSSTPLPILSDESRSSSEENEMANKPA